jgi:hypothetical protein
VTNPAPTTTQVVHLDFIALADHVSDADIEDLIAEAATLTQLENVITAGVIRANSNEHRAQPPLSRRGASTSPPGASAAAAGVLPFAQSSDFDLAFFFVLETFTSLEPFGTNERYIHFLQGKVARMLRSFAGADIALQQAFPPLQPHASCLAVIAPDETYDWEIRTALEAWATETEAASRAESPLSRGGVVSSLDAPASTPAREGVVSSPDAPASIPTPGVVSSPDVPAPTPAPVSAIGLAIGERQRYRGCVLNFTTAPVTAKRIANRQLTSTLIAGRAARL